MSIEAMKMALEDICGAKLCEFNSMSGRSEMIRLMDNAITALRQAIEQAQKPKYRRGDRLVCLETEEFCVIHISGTDRQFIKFPDTQICVYTNEQVFELFELLPKEIEQAEQEPVAWMTINDYGEEDDIWYTNPEGKLIDGWTYKPLYTHPADCPTCEYHKNRAARWRAEAYKRAGHDVIERPWVGLTDEEVESYWDYQDFQVGCGRGDVIQMVRDIEAKLKEKNA